MEKKKNREEEQSQKDKKKGVAEMFVDFQGLAKIKGVDAFMHMDDLDRIL